MQIKRSDVAAVLMLALSVTALGGCVSHVHYPFSGRFVSVSDAPSPEVFEYSYSLDNVSLADTGRSQHGYMTRHFAMPASFDNGQPKNIISGTYYDSGAPGKKALAIVLPVWGVSAYPSTRMTKAILKRSGGRINVLRIDGEQRLIAWEAIERSESYEGFVAGVANSVKRLKHAVIDVRRIVDWAESRPELDRQRIGLVGFSISAIIASLAVQSDVRVESAALVMGGANIAAIISHCPGNEKRTREAVMRNLGLNVQTYERVVTVLFEGMDPTDHPNRASPEDILMVDAAGDDCIPKESRDAWWDALGRPERITLNYSHRRSFLAMTPLGFNFLRKRIYEHLVDTL